MIDIDFQRKNLIAKLLYAFGGLIFGLMISKYSAVAGYELGVARATAQLDHEQEIRLMHFDKHRNESCLSWWWDDSYKNLKAAQFYMCQNQRKWK